MAYQSFEDLDVWKRACRLAVEVVRAFGKSKEISAMLQGLIRARSRAA